jgi:hypothetical protein
MSAALTVHAPHVRQLFHFLDIGAIGKSRNTEIPQSAPKPAELPSGQKAATHPPPTHRQHWGGGPL